MKKNNTLVQVLRKVIFGGSLLTSTVLLASGNHDGGHEDMSKMQNMDMNKVHKKMTKTNNHMGDHMHNGKMQNHMNANGKTNEQEAKLKKVRLIRDYSYVAFANTLSNEGLDFINMEELKGTLPAPLNVQVVKDIVERAECLCGAPIHPGTIAFENIQKLTKDAADPVLLSRIHNARAQLTVVKDKLTNAKDDLAENYKICEDKEKEIKALENKKEAISLEIDGVNLEDISVLNNNLKITETKKLETTRSIARHERDIEDTEREVKMIKGSLARVSHLGREVEKFRKLISTTDEIMEIIDETLVSTEKMVRNELSITINSFLEKFVRQDYTAQINPNTYAISLTDRDSRIINASDGQRLILSLTFISSLLEIARERKNLTSNILTAGAIAPFIIDAPFGVLDNMYKSNIAEVIPKSVGQVIFLLSSSHWEGSVEEKLRSKVGAEYNLLLQVASPQNGREANSIEIGETVYQTATYDAEKDMTTIQEVGSYV